MGVICEEKVIDYYLMEYGYPFMLLCTEGTLTARQKCFDHLPFGGTSKLFLGNVICCDR